MFCAVFSPASPYGSYFFANFSSSFQDLGFFLFCSWPTQSQGEDPQAPVGCSIRTSRSATGVPHMAEPFLNILSKSAPSCGEGAVQFAGAARSLIDVTVSIDLSKKEVREKKRHIMWLIECFRGQPRGGPQFCFVFGGSPDPFSCIKMSVFDLKTCTPVKGTP